MIENIVAGALFDFAGFLTCLKEPYICGSEHDAAPMVQLLEEFAASRGLKLDDADVQDWKKEVTSA